MSANNSVIVSSANTMSFVKSRRSLIAASRRGKTFLSTQLRPAPHLSSNPSINRRAIGAACSGVQTTAAPYSEAMVPSISLKKHVQRRPFKERPSARGGHANFTLIAPRVAPSEEATVWRYPGLAYRSALISPPINSARGAWSVLIPGLPPHATNRRTSRTP